MGWKGPKGGKEGTSVKLSTIKLNFLKISFLYEDLLWDKSTLLSLPHVIHVKSAYPFFMEPDMLPLLFPTQPQHQLRFQQEFFSFGMNIEVKIVRKSEQEVLHFTTTNLPSPW